MEVHSCADHVPIFKHLDEESLKKVNSLLIHGYFKKGEIIMSPIDPVCLFIIAKGRVKEYQLSLSGKEQILRVHEPGAVLGENSIFSDEAPKSYCEAISDLEICYINQEDFKRLLLDYPSISLKLLAEFNRKLMDTEKQNLELATESATSRIASYIYELSLLEEANIFRLPMSMKELAGLLATTPETISRRLKDFEEAGYILRKGRKIEIINGEDFEEYIWDLKNE